MQTKIRTVQQHILDEERLHPGATGDFTALLTTLTLSAKIISREVNKAGLVKIPSMLRSYLDEWPVQCFEKTLNFVRLNTINALGIDPLTG